MADAKGQSVEQDQQKSARPVSPNTGEISEADLQKFAGGTEGPTEELTFEYGGLQIRYTAQQNTGG